MGSCADVTYFLHVSVAGPIPPPTVSLLPREQYEQSHPSLIRTALHPSSLGAQSPDLILLAPVPLLKTDEPRLEP